MGGIGLVLGAGGVVGQAYHAGVLAALEHECGWDARRAEVIVGTSAGSIVGTLLRVGVPAGQLAAWTMKAPLDVEGEALRDLFGDDFPELDAFRAHTVLTRAPRMPHRDMLARALRRPWQFRPLAAALTLVAPGHRDIVEHLAPLRAVEGDGWPERPLWICAVRRRDGRRVVFGRPGAPAAPLHLAVAASCAVPGYFAPVRIGAHAYVDGGAHSPTNAAVLRDRRDLDLVVVVSPMSGPGGLPVGLNGLLRQHSHHRLAQELRALRAAGIPVVAIEPTGEEQAVMGDDLLSCERLVDVVRQAFWATREKLASDPIRAVAEPLLVRAASRRGGGPTDGCGAVPPTDASADARPSA